MQFAQFYYFKIWVIELFTSLSYKYYFTYLHHKLNDFYFLYFRVFQLSLMNMNIEGAHLSEMLELYVGTKLSEPEINARRYRRGLTICDLKNKLEMITGRSANTMMLSVYDKDKLIAKLDDDDSQLGSYPVESGMFLLVDDPAFESLDQDDIDSYKMTKEEYDAKQVWAFGYIALDRDV